MVPNILHSDVDVMYLVIDTPYLDIDALYLFVDPLYSTVDAFHFVADVLYFVVNPVRGLQAFCSGHPGLLLGQFVQSLQRILDVSPPHQLLQKSL